MKTSFSPGMNSTLPLFNAYGMVGMKNFNNDQDNLRNINKMEQKPENVADCSDQIALRHPLSAVSALRTAALKISVSHAGRTILIACLSALAILSTVLSKQAHAQHASTAPNVTKETGPRSKN